MPAEGEVGVTLSCQITIQNNTNLVQEVQLMMREESPYFLNAGEQDAQLVLTAGDKQRCQLVLLPIRTGELMLPEFILQSRRYNTRFPVRQPRTIFIKPPCTPLISSNNERKRIGSSGYNPSLVSHVLPLSDLSSSWSTSSVSAE
jgi:hypothetical protein